MKLTRTVVYLPLVLAAALFAGSAGDGYAQGAKMTVGQTGTNPGTALYFIAEKENLFTKHGLNVNIVKTNTAAAVQAMLGGSMQMSTGSGAAAFVTATLEGAPPLCLGRLVGQCLPLQSDGTEGHYESRRSQRKDRSCRSPLWNHTRHRFEICSYQAEIGSREGCEARAECQSPTRRVSSRPWKREMFSSAFWLHRLIESRKRAAIELLLALPGSRHSLAAERRMAATILSQ